MLSQIASPNKLHYSSTKVGNGIQQPYERADMAFGCGSRCNAIDASSSEIDAVCAVVLSSSFKYEACELKGENNQNVQINDLVF